jgi:hypothetical protein
MQHPISLTPLPLGSSLCMAWRLGEEEEEEGKKDEKRRKKEEQKKKQRLTSPDSSI